MLWCIDLPRSQTSVLRKGYGYALAKSETCFLKEVVSFKYRRIVSARAIKLQYQTKTAESFRKTEERNKKDQERRVQRLLQKKRSRDEDGEVQDLAVLKRIKRAAEFNEKRAARRKSLFLNGLID